MSDFGAAPPRAKRRPPASTVRLRVYVTCRNCGDIDGFWQEANRWECGGCGRRQRIRRELVIPASEFAQDPAEIATVKALANRALLACNDQEYKLVTRRYGFHTGNPMDFTEIADDMLISLNRAYALHRSAMRKMRAALGVKRVLR